MNELDTANNEVTEPSSTDDELRLEPLRDRPQADLGGAEADLLRRQKSGDSDDFHFSRQRLRNPHASLYGIDSPVTETSDREVPAPSTLAPAVHSTIDSVTTPPQYSLLRSMRRVYRVTGYLVILAAFLTFFYQVLRLPFVSDEESASGLATLLYNTFALAAGSVFVAGTLFAFSELIQLALDLHESSVGKSNSGQRHR